VIKKGSERDILITDSHSNYIRKITSEVTCFGKNQFDSQVCSGSGYCIRTDECICQENRFTGPQCETPICFGQSAREPHVCNGFGTCTGPDQCACRLENSGRTCAQCFGAPSVQCSGHGVCEARDQCVCQRGYTGFECQYPICNGTISTSSKVCMNRGTCQSPDTCQCKEGYLGRNCEFPVCNSIAANDGRVCNGHGKCMDVDTCDCEDGYSQKFCDQQDLTSVIKPTDSTSIALFIIFPTLFVLFIAVCVAVFIFIQRRIHRRRMLIEKGLEQKMNDIYFTKDYQVELLSENGEEEKALAPYIIPIEDIHFLSKIGAGGFGTVFQAKWKEVTVAVKVISNSSLDDEEDSDEFEKEASVMNSLKHPNIVSCYGVSFSDNKKLMVMEYLENGSLEKIIADLRNGHKKCSMNQKLSYLLDVANGMAYLHNLRPNPIIHRDLKPGNVLLDNSNRCKICDFGLSRIVSNSVNNLTNHVGSYFYMPNVSITQGECIVMFVLGNDFRR